MDSSDSDSSSSDEEELALLVLLSRSDSDSSSSDEEELALLVLLSRSGSQCRSDRFNFEQPASAAVWKSKFRFEKDGIIALVMHFQLPDPFPTPQRYQVSALEALCIFFPP
ncbi:hypothetical protein PC129_g3689 [Phytophthora cactorum]|uniref:Uncharacterized protein n=1 Tax=Phytophthora cactorum TaxID=29920 RepID=A0A8T1DR81_9STRA|nr:hypothetical protein Pcac1_g9034 [Phytophthora cactorum]KAG2845871.1 hypothetical protein PC112_g1653 [Phytophthora cactorum]KAG2847432.1 hypothetical protein PC111_g778 [Phytophthora cactorum]KAG2868119.1 hypothetical protein PC113_g1312 [Phytophthora cactorum]KAG2932972.1 hypothetical protein PC114_g1592 [Phytophthora cactorum]